MAKWQQTKKKNQAAAAEILIYNAPPLVWHVLDWYTDGI